MGAFACDAKAPIFLTIKLRTEPPSLRFGSCNLTLRKVLLASFLERANQSHELAELPDLPCHTNSLPIKAVPKRSLRRCLRKREMPEWEF